MKRGASAIIPERLARRERSSRLTRHTVSTTRNTALSADHLIVRSIGGFDGSARS